MKEWWTMDDSNKREKIIWREHLVQMEEIKGKVSKFQKWNEKPAKLCGVIDRKKE